jgi:hypothetical protein
VIPPDDLSGALQSWGITHIGGQFVEWLRSEQSNLAERILLSSQTTELELARVQGAYNALYLIIQAIELEPTTQEID